MTTCPPERAAGATKVNIEHLFEKPVASNTRSCLATTVANIRSPYVSFPPEVNVTALAHQLPQLERTPRLVLLPAYQGPAYQGPAPVSPTLYWKRRLVALVVLATLALGAWSLATNAMSLVGANAASTPASAGAVSAPGVVQSQQWTVRPGDTLWSIARSVKPSGDIRPVLNPLIKQYAGQPLQVGQSIAIPAFKP